ncbi:ADP-ribosyltransferase [Methanimicrococcus sp. OttesenSCG-928-J09]|nr:ADP-ribosyltransferase [Methanimicrococcus sp. OttesenSCG-928-J09]
MKKIQHEIDKQAITNPLPGLLTESIPDSYFKNLGNIVAETRSVYGSNSKFQTPFLERNDLLPREKTSIGNYQDIHFWNHQKRDWSIPIPSGWEQKAWCYMMNSYCRYSDFQKRLQEDERNEIKFNIQNIDRSILKSETDEEYTLYRCIENDDWMDKTNGIGYVEKAFASYSLNLNHALKYANPDNPILLLLNIQKGTHALYIDESEREVLMPRNTAYIAESIEKIKFSFPTGINTTTLKETIVYNLKIQEKWK